MNLGSACCGHSVRRLTHAQTINQAEAGKVPVASHPWVEAPHQACRRDDSHIHHRPSEATEQASKEGRYGVAQLCWHLFISPGFGGAGTGREGGRMRHAAPQAYHSLPRPRRQPKPPRARDRPTDTGCRPRHAPPERGPGLAEGRAGQTRNASRAPPTQASHRQSGPDARGTGHTTSLQVASQSAGTPTKRHG